MSGIAPERETITGLDDAMPSTTESPNASSQWEGTTTTLEAARIRSTSCRSPRKRTREATPRSAARARKGAGSPPPPAPDRALRLPREQRHRPDRRLDPFFVAEARDAGDERRLAERQFAPHRGAALAGEAGEVDSVLHHLHPRRWNAVRRHHAIRDEAGVCE